MNPFWLKKIPISASLYTTPMFTYWTAADPPSRQVSPENFTSVVPASLLQQLPALKVVSVMGVGYDGIDVAAAKAAGVMVTHTPDVLNDDVADTALGLMLCASRQLPAADRAATRRRPDADAAWPRLFRGCAGTERGLESDVCD